MKILLVSSQDYIPHPVPSRHYNILNLSKFINGLNLKPSTQ